MFALALILTVLGVSAALIAMSVFTTCYGN